ncbi:hypothetical protein ACLKMH_09890 [Psychromonas sp. KJ10-10]|uniref:hypothetical protein n=1 Tax=Psychromonas sp. KJ10-10 TaxID=3391823 RepID=UPI0039B55367
MLRKHPKFIQYKAELSDFIENSAILAECSLEVEQPALASLADNIPAQLTRGVTLSTMHGCPPTEIEAICRYMIAERGINTYVKLNPTLLGFKRVREILDQSGFTNVSLSEEAFTKDLQLDAC